MKPHYRLPTVAEVLGGQVQGDVPRPTVSTDALFEARPAAARPQSLFQRLVAMFRGTAA